MKRQNGSGTLIKTSTGLYIAKWMFNKKIYTRSTQCYEEDKALLKLAEFTRPFQESNSIAVLENIEAKIRTIEKTAYKERIPLSEMFDKYTHNVNVVISIGTKNLRNRILNYFLTWLKINHKEITYVDELKKDVVEEYLSTLTTHINNLSYNNTLSILKLLFNFFNNTSFNSFKKRKVLIEDKRTLTVDEIDKILNACKTLDDKILFYTAVYTGMRKSDICSLKWSNIDFEKNIIVKRAIKTNIQFIVPIHPKLLNVLKTAYKKNCNEEYVSPRLKRLYNSNDALDKLFKRIYVRSKINLDGIKIGLHIFRHTFCTNCANNGIPLQVLMKMLGHTQPSTTMRYYNNFNAQDVQNRLVSIM